MKKLLLTTLFTLILSALSFAQTVQKTYYFGTPMVSEVNGYDVISFAGTRNMGETGKATLPCQQVSLLLPPNTQAQNISVSYDDIVELEGTYNLLPSQQVRPLSSTEPIVFEKDEDFYRSGETYPLEAASKVSSQYLNGCSFAMATFTPVQYVPATGKVSYARTVTVTVEYAASRADKGNLLWMTPEVKAKVERMAQNPEAVADYKTRGRSISGYELLVITPEAWVSHFDEYVAFYEARGLRTHVTALEDILANFDGRDNAEKVFNYTKQEYENNGIMLILLGGDAGLVPWRALYCYVSDEYVDNLPADMYYGCFDTNWDENNNGLWGEIGEDDMLPEVGVGRMPFNNETQFRNMMHKTLEYQSNPVLGEFNTVILGAEHMGDGYYGSTDLERLIGGSSEYGYTTVGIPEEYTFVKIYEGSPSGWSGNIFKNAINANGGQYVFHCGHANTDYVAGWYVNTTDDSSFAKLDGVTHNYGLFNSHGCICGDFTHTCMLERLVNISTGFVATTGNSRYGWYAPWGDGMAAHLNREFVDAYYNDRLPYIGTAFVEMKIMTAPYVATPWGDDGAMRWNLYDINILGDVAVCPWLDEPFRPEVSYASALPMGATTTPVTITYRGEAQSNFRCSIFHNGELLAFGMTDDNGNANIDFADALDVADTLQLIITGPNAWPQTIDIIGINANTAFVYPQDIDIHGDFLFGRNISMDVDFKNVGTVDANNVVATLSSSSNYVTMSKSTVNVGTINAGSSVVVADAFDIEVANNIPDGTYVDFVMTCTDGTNVWNRDVFFQAVAPVMTINELTYEEVSGNMNGFLDPGETFRLTATGKNTGHYLAENPYIHGSLNSEYLTFVSNDTHFANVAAGAGFEGSVDIRIADDAPNGTTININVSAITGQYSSEKNIVLTVGTVQEGFESGDFSHLNWMLEGDDNWFITDAEAHTGTFSAQSPELSKHQSATLMVDMENTTDGQLSFYYKMHIKHNRAALIIYLDNVVKDMLYGDLDWTLYRLDLPAGQHNIKWCYYTAQSGNVEEYVCWVDDITFPGNTMILGVESVEDDSNMVVYPNPANDIIYVKGDNIQYVEIYNTVGSRVISKNVIDSESINIADLTSGIYFVRIVDKQGNTTTTKIVKR